MSAVGQTPFNGFSESPFIIGVGSSLSGNIFRIKPNINFKAFQLGSDFDSQIQIGVLVRDKNTRPVNDLTAFSIRDFPLFAENRFVPAIQLPLPDNGSGVLTPNHRARSINGLRRHAVTKQRITVDKFPYRAPRRVSS
jgi:hypothetical protein